MSPLIVKPSTLNVPKISFKVLLILDYVSVRPSALNVPKISSKVCMIVLINVAEDYGGRCSVPTFV